MKIYKGGIDDIETNIAPPMGTAITLETDYKDVVIYVCVGGMRVDRNQEEANQAVTEVAQALQLELTAAHPSPTADSPSPGWFNDIPLCVTSCPHHDGKRCALLGFPPDRICEPEVRRTVREKDRLHRRELELIRLGIAGVKDGTIKLHAVGVPLEPTSGTDENCRYIPHCPPKDHQP